MFKPPRPNFRKDVYDPRYGLGTFDRVSDYVTYDPEAGIFIRKKATQGKYVGQQAGFVHSSGKYRVLSVGGVIYEEHTLAYICGTGLLPQGEIRHLNGDPFDNRLDNLRDWVDQDDQNAGIFEDPATGEWHVLLYTRGATGRKPFGVYKTRAEAAAVSERALEFLNQGTDVRRVKTLLGLRNRALKEQVEEVRRKGPVYEPVDYEGEVRWTVRKLLWDRRIPGIGQPVYGPFETKEGAKEAVVEYYRLREKGEGRVTSLRTAGLTLLTKDGAGWRIVPLQGNVTEEKASKWKDEPLELQKQVGRDGVERWLIPYLPNSPAAVVHKWYVATGGGLTAAMSEEETWRAVKEYQILRNQTWDHFAAMRRAGLAEWDFLSQRVKQGQQQNRELLPVRILEDEVGKWFISGLRKLTNKPGKLYRDYGFFSTKEEAEKALDYYSRMAPVDPELKLGGHDFALHISGLAKAERP
jgi:hypothetical protein